MTPYTRTSRSLSLLTAIFLNALNPNQGTAQTPVLSDDVKVYRNREGIQYVFNRKAAAAATNSWQSVCELVRFKLPEYRRIADDYLKTKKQVKDPLTFFYFEIASIVNRPDQSRPPGRDPDSELTQSWFLKLHYFYENEIAKSESVLMLFDGTIAREIPPGTQREIVPAANQSQQPQNEK